jgi:hypothetical protein
MRDEQVARATPGPWIQDESNPLCIGTPKSSYPPDVYEIVTMLEGGDGYRDEYNAKALANARLIADAPALLDALAGFVEWNDRRQLPQPLGGPFGILIGDARALLRKHGRL